MIGSKVKAALPASVNRKLVDRRAVAYRRALAFQRLNV
jgi:hypothetical protein